MPKFICIYFFLLVILSPFFVACQRLQLYTDALDGNLLNGDDLEWTGRWFPDKPADNHRENVFSSLSKDQSDPVDFQYLEEPPKDSMMMSMIGPACDNGKENISLDWPKTPANYTCVSYLKKYFWPNPELPAVIRKSYVPPAYKARHVCMNEEITYSSNLPTFGPHRAAWPRYGEYTFVPRQRWLHSLEHGAVVMLYHPCAHPYVVQQVKKIVKSCLFRHIITPYNLLPHERPIALLTWGWSILLPDIDEDLVVKFIKEHALQGPENIIQDGQYDFELKEAAKIVTTPDDSGGLCPRH